MLVSTTSFVPQEMSRLMSRELFPLAVCGAYTWGQRWALPCLEPWTWLPWSLPHSRHSCSLPGHLALATRASGYQALPIFEATLYYKASLTYPPFSLHLMQCRLLPTLRGPALGSLVVMSCGFLCRQGMNTVQAVALRWGCECISRTSLGPVKGWQRKRNTNKRR